MNRLLPAAAVAMVLSLTGCDSGNHPATGAAASSSGTAPGSTSDSPAQKPDAQASPSSATASSAAGSPARTSAGRGTGSTGDTVAATDCLSTQEAYAPVVAAMQGSDEAVRDAASAAPTPPLDTNTTTTAGKAVVQAILNLQEEDLQLAARGTSAIPDFQARVTEVRQACRVVGVSVLGQ